MKGISLYLLATTTIFAAHSCVHDHTDTLQGCVTGLLGALALPGMAGSYIATGHLEDPIIWGVSGVFWLFALMVNRERGSRRGPVLPEPVRGGCIIGYGKRTRVRYEDVP